MSAICLNFIGTTIYNTQQACAIKLSTEHSMRKIIHEQFWGTSRVVRPVALHEDSSV